MIQKLALYFMEKGEFLNYREYKAANDGPFKAPQIRRVVGSWSLVERMIARNFPKEYALIIAENSVTEVQEEEEVVYETDEDEE